MANANIAIVTTNKTFDEWRVATNDLITDRNILRNSDYVKDDGDFYIKDGKLQISRAAGGTTLTNENDALIGGVLTTTDLTVIDDAIIGGNASMISAHARLTVNNNIYSRNIESNSLITAVNVFATGYVTITGAQKDLNNNILNVNSFLQIASSGNVNATTNVNVDGLLKTNKSTGTGLQVTANAVIDGNLIVGTNGFISQNLNVSNWVNSTGLKADQLIITGFSNLNSANIITGNITTARITTLNVNTASAIAEVANLVVANSRTKNAYIESLTVGNELTSLNVAVLTVSSQLNAVSANIQTLEVTSLTVKDPIQAPSESDSSSYRLRVSQTTPGDGFFGVYQGSPQRGNALIQFNSSTSSWRLTSNSTQGLYSTILTSSNVLTSVTSTSTSEAASASSVKTAYDQAIVALAQANAASNLVSVLANGVVRVANANINFNNTSTVNVSVTGGGSRLANIEFSVNTSVITNQTISRNAYDQANTGTTVARNAYDQANTANTNAGTAGTNATTATNIGRAAYDQANTANTNAGTALTQATNARAAANSAANTVRVSANSGSTLSARQLNFINTSTVTVTVTANPDGSNANVAFTSIGGGGGTTSPGGSNKQVQFNNSGTFGGASDLNYDSGTQRVGIGTSSPYKKLEVVGGGLSVGPVAAGSSQLGIELGDLLTSVPSSQVRGIIGVGDSSIGLAGDMIYQPRSDIDSSHRFYAKGSELLRITFDGKVGVGTATPRSKFEVANGTLTSGVSGVVLNGRFDNSFPSSGDGYFQLRTNNSAGSTGGLDIFSNNNGTMRLSYKIHEEATSSYHAWNVNGAERMRIFPTGRLNLNTATGFVGFNFGTISDPVRGNMYFDSPDDTGYKFEFGRVRSGSFVTRVTLYDYGSVEIPHSVTTGNVYTQRVEVAGISPVVTVDGVSVRNASILNSGTVAPARLGSGTASATTYLAGDSTYKPINNFLRNVSGGYPGGNVFISTNQPVAGAIGDIWIEI